MNEPTRLLKAMVDFIADRETKDIPDHDCDYKESPDKGHCQFCYDWVDAMGLCYPNFFEKEDDVT